jgi:hypothetical protein
MNQRTGFQQKIFSLECEYQLFAAGTLWKWISSIFWLKLLDKFFAT